VTHEDATRSLQSYMQKFPWLTAVGMGKDGERDVLFVYVTSTRHRELENLKNGWEGFPVVIEKMAAPRPIPACR
jgi:hypothetical protein